MSCRQVSTVQFLPWVAWLLPVKFHTVLLIHQVFWNENDKNIRKNKMVVFTYLYTILLKMKSYGLTIQMKATEQCFPVVQSIMLFKVVLIVESEDEILWCDHSNASFWAVLSCGTVYYAVQVSSTFWDLGWNPLALAFKWKLLSSSFLWYCLLCCTRHLYRLSQWKQSYRVTTQ